MLNCLTEAPSFNFQLVEMSWGQQETGQEMGLSREGRCPQWGDTECSLGQRPSGPPRLHLGGGLSAELGAPPSGVQSWLCLLRAESGTVA